MSNKDTVLDDVRLFFLLCYSVLEGQSIVQQVYMNVQVNTLYGGFVC